MSDWTLSAVKRWWVPNWLYTLLGQAPVRQPWRWVFTRKATRAEIDKTFEGIGDELEGQK